MPRYCIFWRGFAWRESHSLTASLKGQWNEAAVFECWLDCTTGLHPCICMFSSACVRSSTYSWGHSIAELCSLTDRIRAAELSWAGHRYYYCWATGVSHSTLPALIDWWWCPALSCIHTCLPWPPRKGGPTVYNTIASCSETSPNDISVQFHVTCPPPPPQLCTIVRWMCTAILPYLTPCTYQQPTPLAYPIIIQHQHQH